jgi:hypothetical protein
MKMSTIALLLAAILGAIVGGVIIRKFFPRDSITYVQLPGETVTIEVPELGVWIDRRFETRVDTVPGQSPPPDTVYREVLVALPCGEATFPERFLVTNLDAPDSYYFEDPEARTALSVERLSLIEGVFSRQQQLLTYPNLGPLAKVRTSQSGVMVEFHKPAPPPKRCDFWCQLGKMGIGFAVGVPAGAIACAAVN